MFDALARAFKFCATLTGSSLLPRPTSNIVETSLLKPEARQIEQSGAAKTLTDSKTVSGGKGGEPLREAPAISFPRPEIRDHELIARVGRGSYGEVWLARNVMGTYRAVKIVYRTAFEHARPFEREFNGIKKFEPLSRSHDGFIDILQVGRAEQYFYYVMELADDQVTDQNIDPENYKPKSLRSELRQHRRLPFEKCIELGISLTQALVHLHRHGLIHRDIKPSNIIFVNGILKLADIGLVAEQSEAKSFVGTEGFIPPEGPGTAQGDLYSLGKVLYEIATGRDRLEFPALPSFLGDKDEDTRLLELNSVFLKACEPELKLRYQSAEEMREDLLLLQSGKSVKKAQQTERRLAWLTRVSLAGLMITLLALAGIYALKRQAKREAVLRARAETARLETQKSAYASDMSSAFHALEDGHLGRLRELLAKHVPTTPNISSGELATPDLRGWEWRYLQNRARGDDLLILRGHSNEVAKALFLRGGRRIFSVSMDGTLRFWDLETKSMRSMTQYSYGFRTADLSPDSQFIALGGENGDWSLWDIERQKIVFEGKLSSSVIGCAFSPEGQKLAVADDSSVEVWDVDHRTNVLTLPRSSGGDDGFFHGLAFSPDGKSLAYGHGDARIFLYDFTTKSTSVVGFTSDGDALSLAFSHDGHTLVSADRKQITVWDISGRSPPRFLTEHLEQPECIAFSPDGSLLASASGDQTIRLWSTETWRSLAILRGHEKEVRSVSFSHDGKYLVSSGKDGTVRIWSVVQSPTQRASVTWTNLPTFFPDRLSENRLVVYSSQQEDGDSIRFLDLRRLELSDAQRLPSVFRSPAAFAVSPDAKWMAVGLKKGSVEIWSTKPLRKIRSIGRPDTEPAFLAFAENLSLLALAGRDQKVEVWDWDHNKVLQTLPVLEGCIESTNNGTYAYPLGFWSGNRLLAILTVSPRGDETIQIHSIPSGPEHRIQPIHDTGLNNFALSSDGHVLATSGWDGEVKLWGVDTERELGEPLRGQMIGFTSLAFSPDGKRLAAGGWDGTITLWDVRTRQQVGNWKAHRKKCSYLSFVDNGHSLVSIGAAIAPLPGSGDWAPQLCIWRAPDLEALEGGGDERTIF